MPEISRDEVAHLADLARIDLDDAELDHLAPQLAVILESIASIREAGVDDVPADVAPAAADQRVPRRRGASRASPRRRRSAARPGVEQQRFEVPRILGDEQ